MTLPSLSLDGKVAIVSGGSRGIGRATALTFAEAGADVAICARNLGPLEEVAEGIRALGRRCLAVQADISIKSEVDNLVQRTAQELGTVDILLNNAQRTIIRPLVELREDGWDKIIDADLKGYYLCSQAAAQVMMEKKKGNIISMVSDSAVRATPGYGAYSIAKAGIVNMTKVLAVELAHYNIRVNAIGPTIVRTESNRHIWDNPETLKEIENMIPLRRIAEESEIAALALFLASEASSYITGQTIYIEGGILA